MLDAIKNDDFETFEETLADAPAQVINCALMDALFVHDATSLKYIRILLRHPCAVVGKYTLEPMIDDADTFDSEVFDLAVTVMIPEHLETVFWYTAGIPNYAAATTVLRAMLQRCSMTDDDIFHTADLFLNCATASKDPTRHVAVLVDAGIDLKRYPRLLPRALTERRPGIGRELVAAGIPKSAAYDTRRLKFEWYRTALVLELSHL